MTPLFVDTQSSQAFNESSPSEEILSSVQVRATQDVQQFTATQETGKLNICFSQFLELFPNEKLFFVNRKC